MSEKKSDGGPAYPIRQTDEDKDYVTHLGLTLRDKFAGDALFAVMLMQQNASMVWGPKKIAEDAFKIADAMLKAREQ